MGKKRYRLLAVILILCLSVPYFKGTYARGEESVGVTAHEIEAGPSWEGNPLKGMFPYSNHLPNNGFAYSMEWFNIPVSDVQTGMNDFNWEKFELQLNAVALKGHQAAFRFYYTYPNPEGDGLGVPDFVLDEVDDEEFLTPYGYEEDGVKYNQLAGKGKWPDHSNEYFLQSMESFIAALGEKYDGDPRIGFVTMGLLGFWGEWHNWPYGDTNADGPVYPEFVIPTDTYRRVMVAYDKAFSKTQVLAREPKEGITIEEYKKYKTGFHDDSFAYSTLPTEYDGADWHYLSVMKEFELTDRWQTNCIGGELYPLLQRFIFMNEIDKEWLLLEEEEKEKEQGDDGSFKYKDVEDWDTCVNLSHTSWLLNDSIAELTADTEGLKDELDNAKAASVQLGYDFQVTKSYYNENQHFGPFTLGVDIKNRGVAPFYYGNDTWPIKVGIMKGDELIGEWMTDWSLNTIPVAEGENEPEEIHFETLFELPVLEKENYDIYMKVVNPLEEKMGKGNILGFANAEQRADGWLKIGELNFKEGEEETTMGESESEPEISGSTYKDITVWEQDGYICAQLDHNISHEKWSLYWDIDHNTSTGYYGWWTGNGYDYMVENYGSTATLYYFSGETGTWTDWTEMKDAIFVWEETEGYICVRIPKSILEPNELDYPAGACYWMPEAGAENEYTEIKWIDGYSWLPVKENSNLPVKYEYSYKNADNEEIMTSLEVEGYVEYYDAYTLTYTDDVISDDGQSITATGDADCYKAGQVKLEIANTGTEDTADILKDDKAQYLEGYKEITDFNQGENGEIILNTPEAFSVTKRTTYYMLKITNEDATTKDVATYIPFRVTVKVGEVSIRAYQMNLNTAPGGVSEFNPSFRVVSRAPKLMLDEDGDLRAVVGSGTLYVIGSEWSDEDIVVGGEGVHDVPTTDQGYLYNWPTADTDKDDYMYYAVTFMGTTYHLDMLTYQFKLKAYAILDNKEVVLEEEDDDDVILDNNDVVHQKARAHETSIYDIAKTLYDGNMMNTEWTHNFLYDHVLNIVAIQNNRSKIASAMCETLGVKSSGDEKYPLINNAYKDLLYYISLTKKYACDRYSDRKPFESLTEYDEGITETYLLKELNKASGTEYKLVREWIYEKVPDDGFYKKVTWNARNSLAEPQ